ncbi:MAG: hypothetical protein Q7K03_07235 [Dehalococcoidia bacterium]|nr:hypothetical protein [Dehalococcoidia bacterium]
MRRIGGKVDIGPLLFEVFDFNRGGKTTNRNHERKPSLARLELPYVDREIGDSFQGPDVDLLAGRYARVSWERLDSRREVPNTVNLMRWEKFSA